MAHRVVVSILKRPTPVIEGRRSVSQIEVRDFEDFTGRDLVTEGVGVDEERLRDLLDDPSRCEKLRPDGR